MKIKNLFLLNLFVLDNHSTNKIIPLVIIVAGCITRVVISQSNNHKDSKLQKLDINTNQTRESFTMELSEDFKKIIVSKIIIDTRYVKYIEKYNE